MEIKEKQFIKLSKKLKKIKDKLNKYADVEENSEAKSSKIPYYHYNKKVRVHPELSHKLTSYIRTGIGKKERDGIVSKYPTPNTCRYLRAPILNKEIVNVLPVVLRKQDMYLKEVQNLLTASLYSLSPLITEIITANNKNNKNIDMLPNLADATKLICDVVHFLSLHRRYLLMPILDKYNIKMLENSKVGPFLFGGYINRPVRAAKRPSEDDNNNNVKRVKTVSKIKKELV